MDAQLFGSVDKPAVIVVSSWDPLVPESRAFLRELVTYTRAHDQSAVAIVLDPAPQRYLRGPSKWPVYMSFRARSHWLFCQGLDGVVRIDFREPDLKRGVYDLLDIVRAQIPLAEIWMRPNQTFGRVAPGSRMAVAMYAKRHALAWKSPRTPETRVIANTVHHHLWRGQITKAEAVVGLPPMWSRPESGLFEVAWPAGRYYVALATLETPVRYGEPFAVELHEDVDGISRIEWPAPDAEHLVILGGPGDADVWRLASARESVAATIR